MRSFLARNSNMGKTAECASAVTLKFAGMSMFSVAELENELHPVPNIMKLANNKARIECVAVAKFNLGDNESIGTSLLTD
ncbi:hypothetical protein V4842_08305 [Pseudomonas moraviensis]